MSDFKLTFHRYHATTGSRKSAPLFIHAEDIHGAIKIGGHFIAGMVNAGCPDRILIASVEHMGLQGDQCVDHGSTIWQTPEEWDAQISMAAEVAKIKA